MLTLLRGFFQILIPLAGIFAPPAFLGLLIASLILTFKVRIRPLNMVIYIATVILFVLSVIGIISLVQFADGIAHM